MSKGKQRPPQYNRQSKGYQRNMTKNEMKLRNIEMPKDLDSAKIRRINIIVIICGIILTAAGFAIGGWKLGLFVVLLVLLYFVGVYFYIRNYEKKYILAYKKMGITKDMYIKELKRRGADRRDIDRIDKTWDKVKVKEQ